MPARFLSRWLSRGNDIPDRAKVARVIASSQAKETRAPVAHFRWQGCGRCGSVQQVRLAAPEAPKCSRCESPL